MITRTARTLPSTRYEVVESICPPSSPQKGSCTVFQATPHREHRLATANVYPLVGFCILYSFRLSTIFCWHLPSPSPETVSSAWERAKSLVGDRSLSSDLFRCGTLRLGRTIRR